MRNTLRKCMAILLMFTLLSVSGNSIKVSAGSRKVVKNEKAYLFSVPDGGWSTIRVYINYAESQVKHGNKNNWWRRELYYSYKTEYTTEKPYMRILNNISHINSNGKTIHKFEKWTPCDAMSDGSWEYFAAYRNGKNKYYAPTSKNYAKVSYMVFCDGGILVSNNKENGKTLKVRLNTK